MTEYMYLRVLIKVFFESPQFFRFLTTLISDNQKHLTSLNTVMYTCSYAQTHCSFFLHSFSGLRVTNVHVIQMYIQHSVV